MELSPARRGSVFFNATMAEFAGLSPAELLERLLPRPLRIPLNPRLAYQNSDMRSTPGCNFILRMRNILTICNKGSAAAAGAFP